MLAGGTCLLWKGAVMPANSSSGPLGDLGDTIMSWLLLLGGAGLDAFFSRRSGRRSGSTPQDEMFI